MGVLKIYDASGVIYTGQYNGFGSTASYKGIPTGGLFLLLQKIGECVQRDVPYIVAMDSPTNKQFILPGYKGSRPRDPKILFQNKLFYKYFGETSENVHKIEGKEADTLIAKAVVDNYRNGEQFIDIYGADYDLAHSIDDRGMVRSMPVNSNVGAITRENFESMFSTRDIRVLFNSISMYKVLMGDNSDRVKPIEHQLPPDKLFNLFLGLSIKDGYTGDKLKSMECVDNFILKATPLLGPEGIDEIRRRVSVVYPNEHLVDKDLSYKGVINQTEALSIILSITGCRRLADRLGIRFYEDMGEMQEDARRMYTECHEVNKTRHFVTDMSTEEFSNGRGF